MHLPLFVKSLTVGEFMTVFTYDNSKRAGACRDFLLSSGKIGGFKMLTILPIPTTRDGVHLSGSDVTLASLLIEAEPGEIYLGYAIPEFLRDSLLDSGAIVVDASLDEKFLLENAHLTALATLAHILSRGDVSVDCLSVGVVGYGRIGRELVRLLLSVGAEVRVFSTRRDTVLCLCSSGVDATHVLDGDPIPTVDILVNTAPARIFNECSDVPDTMEILELAGGNYFGEHRVTRLPSLPSRYYPETAGRIYAEALLRALGV